jgi:hypothetical protein
LEVKDRGSKKGTKKEERDAMGRRSKKKERLIIEMDGWRMMGWTVDDWKQENGQVKVCLPAR